MSKWVKEYCPNKAIANINLYKQQLKNHGKVKIDNNSGEGIGLFNNKEELCSLGLEILKKKYCYQKINENCAEDCFARVALAFTEDYEEAKKMYKYMTDLNFIPATPIMANGGLLERGMPISCFLNESGTSLEEKINTLAENARISANWGGIGTLVDGISSKDLMAYCKLLESANWAFYNDDRKSSVAVYLSISHAGIEDFIQMRRPVGGDPRLKTLHLHHGIIIPDEFFNCMRKKKLWPLYENDGSFVKEVDPVELLERITKIRAETGEPYLLYSDRLRDAAPDFHKAAGMYPKTSNLCSEITLYTDSTRTAVCCLGSLNLANYDQWHEDEEIIEAAVTFLDNVLCYTKHFFKDLLPRAANSIHHENSIGLGVMGFHSLLQKRNIPIESEEAKVLNTEIFRKINEKVKAASKKLALARGACEDARKMGVHDVRFAYDIAIAPTATISYVGSCSPGIEPYISNTMLIKNGMGTYQMLNPNLLAVLNSNKNFQMEESFRINVIKQILKDKGSVKNLGFLDQLTKNTYKTAYEIDQMKLIDLAADRQKYISQSQSLNLFFSPEISLKELMRINVKTYTAGLKSVYYSRTRSISPAESTIHNINMGAQEHIIPTINKDEEPLVVCESCI